LNCNIEYGCRDNGEEDEEIQAIFEAIQQLIEPPVEEKPKRRIGFHHD
jgi:hypothetical protein